MSYICDDCKSIVGASEELYIKDTVEVKDPTKCTKCIGKEDGVSGVPNMAPSDTVFHCHICGGNMMTCNCGWIAAGQVKLPSEYVQRARNFAFEGTKLMYEWDKLTLAQVASLDRTVDKDYPFSHSFDEQMSLIRTWVENIELIETVGEDCKVCGR